MHLILFCLSSFVCLLCLFVCLLFHLFRSFGQFVLVTLWTGFPLTYLYYDRAIFYKIQRIFPYKKIRDSYQSLLNVKFAYDICYTQARAEDLWQWRDSSFNSTFSRTTRNEVLSSAPPPLCTPLVISPVNAVFLRKRLFPSKWNCWCEAAECWWYLYDDWLIAHADRSNKTGRFRIDIHLIYIWYV